MKNYLSIKSKAWAGLLMELNVIKLKTLLLLCTSLLILGVSPIPELKSNLPPLDLSAEDFALSQGLICNSDLRVFTDMNAYLKKQTENSPHVGYLKLELISEEAQFYTDIYFNTNATSGLDPGYDAALYGGSPPAFSIYTILQDGESSMPLMIQALSGSAIDDVTLSLGIHAIQGQEVTISITETDITENIEIFLEDNVNETSTLLTENDYVFTVDNDLTGTGRFSLRFNNTALSIEGPITNNLKMISNYNNHTIEVFGSLDTESDLKLYNINGQLMLTQKLDISSDYQTIDVNYVNPGLYILKLESISGHQKAQKLIIK